MFGLKLCLHEGIPEINSGFRIRRREGMMCSVIRMCSRVFEFWIDVM